MTDKVLVVGAGLSGCVAASLLHQHGRSCDLIDARDRPGGRILSTAVADNSNQLKFLPSVDLGPSWFWPHQKHISRLIRDYDLTDLVYEQSSVGEAIIEYADRKPMRVSSGASMAGSFRLDGGMQTLIDKIIEPIPDNQITMGSKLIALKMEGNLVVATLEIGGEQCNEAYSSVILALPPRVARSTIRFEDVDEDQLTAMDLVATWMAAEAKLVLVYKSPFWLNQGLSGDIFSQAGPMGEIHDATPRECDIGALFGFMGPRPLQRKGQEDQIKEFAVKQIQRSFNTDEEPIAIHYKDWAFDELTASQTDHSGQRAHPDARQLYASHDSQRIVWAGTEVAMTENAGYLEGAIETAISAVGKLSHSLAG